MTMATTCFCSYQFTTANFTLLPAPITSKLCNKFNSTRLILPKLMPMPTQAPLVRVTLVEGSIPIKIREFSQVFPGSVAPRASFSKPKPCTSIY